MAAAAKKKAAAPASKRVRVAEDDPAPRKRSRVREGEEPEEDVTEIAQAASNYFAKMDKEGLTFISAGAAIIDCALGGGWAAGRVVNIVGDRSAGKTLLAIEASANFNLQFPKGRIRYAESEAAFDEAYAEALGMPVAAVEFAKKKDKEGNEEPIRTVEDWYADIKQFTSEVRKKKEPALYVLDSLDALSDDAEQKRDIDDGTYGANKAKKLGELFRRVVADLEEANVLLIVISQLRDKIGVMFGEKQTRTGGRALDFYASHIVWLAQLDKIKKTSSGVERVIGVNVRMNVKKNKVGLPFRQCDYPVLFGYGVDDLTANVEWLLSVGAEARLKEEVGMSKAGYKVRIANLRDKGGQEVREIRSTLARMVKEEWERVETGFLPKARKYG